jgi:Zn-dependent protease with chaperone function
MNCKFIFALLLIFSSSAYAQESYWDLESVVSNVQGQPFVKLITFGGESQTLSKDYVLKLYEIKKNISSKSGIYPKFLISSNQELNAFATWQNGQPVTIFTLGLLNKIGDDSDALAAVVSHEFSHLTLRHAQSQETANTIIDLLSGLALIAIDSSYGGSARNPYRGLYKAGISTASNLAASSYSRGDELAADAQGVKYMIAAGYSPDGAVRLQENIIPSSSSFFSTHPSSESRIKNIKLAANEPLGQSNSTPSRKDNGEPTNTVYVENTTVNNSISNTYVGDAVFGSFAKICEEEKGLDPKSSQLDVCVFKLKRASLNLYSTGVNLPKKGQIGSIVSIKEKQNYIIFASSIGENLPVGTKIMIDAEGGAYASGKISKFFDGYYLADVDNAKSINQGSRVIIDN